MALNQKGNNSIIIDSPSLYFHIPFCEKKCIYCDFYSVAKVELINQYINSIIKEIDLKTDLFLSETSQIAHNNLINYKLSPKSIYLGGGTPSILNIEQISLIVNKIKEKFNFNQLEEFTIEVNPNSVDLSKLSAYLDLGINRLSIGVQSLNSKELKFLGRIHTPEQAIKSIQLAKEAGFTNISCDIIYSIPKQKISSIKHTIDELIKLNIQHISAYTLIFEEGTPLFNKYIKGEIIPNRDSKEEILFLEICDYLNKNNFKQYEISNFAKDNFQSKHNLNYWRKGEYLGFGASAHSYFNNQRIKNYSNVEKYCDLISSNKLAIEFKEVLTKEQNFIEAIYLGLRAEGIDFEEIKNDFNIDLLTTKSYLIEYLLKEKKANLIGTKLALNSSGYALCDYLTTQFIG